MNFPSQLNDLLLYDEVDLEIFSKFLIEDPAICPDAKQVQLELDLLGSEDPKESFFDSCDAGESLNDLDITNAERFCSFAIQRNYESLDAHRNFVKCQRSAIIREAEMRELVSVFRPIYLKWMLADDNES